jgi:four helix bundle protein
MDSCQKPETRAEALKARTKQFAVAAIRLCRQFPRSVDGFVVAKQLTKSATATAANYRAACRARSAVEFAARIGVVAEEADESEFWLELTIEADVLQGEQVQSLRREAGQLAAIFTASRNTAKRNLRRAQR